MLTAWKTIGVLFKRYPEITPREQESWKTIGVATGIGAKVVGNDRCAIQWKFVFLLEFLQNDRGLGSNILGISDMSFELHGKR